MPPDLIPPVLAQLGTAVVILYLVLQIVRVGMQFAGKMPTDRPADHSSRTEWRLSSLDKRVDECVTRSEYESSRRDMREQLNRIESKLDNMWGSRRLFVGKEDDR